MNDKYDAFCQVSGWSMLKKKLSGRMCSKYRKAFNARCLNVHVYIRPCYISSNAPILLPVKFCGGKDLKILAGLTLHRWRALTHQESSVEGFVGSTPPPPQGCNQPPVDLQYLVQMHMWYIGPTNLGANMASVSGLFV